MTTPIYQQITATGTATAIILDTAQTPFNVSAAVELQSGTGTFSIQYTLDNPNAAIDWGAPGYLNPARNTTVTWFNDVNVATTSASGVTNYMFPVQALRRQLTKWYLGAQLIWLFSHSK